MTPDILLEALFEGGYLREDPVTAPGQIARRGGIVDVYPSDADTPVRIEFLGDTVESLRRFDPDTQRTVARLDALTTLPLADVFVTRSVLDALRPRIQERYAGHRELRGVLESLERGLLPEGLVELVPLVGGATVAPWAYLPRVGTVVIEPDRGWAWSSTRKTRSASPSKASPMSAPASRTDRWRSFRFSSWIGSAGWFGNVPSSSG